MKSTQSAEFHEVLEMAESLPAAQQGNLIGIIRHRLIESRRDAISCNIRTAKNPRESGLQPTPSLMDLCNVGGERCFSSAREVDEYIRGLRGEWL